MDILDQQVYALRDKDGAYSKEFNRVRLFMLVEHAERARRLNRLAWPEREFRVVAFHLVEDVSHKEE